MNTLCSLSIVCPAEIGSGSARWRSFFLRFVITGLTLFSFAVCDLLCDRFPLLCDRIGSGAAVAGWYAKWIAVIYHSCWKCCAYACFLLIFGSGGFRLSASWLFSLLFWFSAGCLSSGIPSRSAAASFLLLVFGLICSDLFRLPPVSADFLLIFPHI